MALSEAGGGFAAVQITGPKGKRVTVKPRKGPAPSGPRSFYVRPKASRKGRRK